MAAAPAVPSIAATVTFTVSGNASPWTAGMPAGTKDAYDPATVTSSAAVLAGLTLQPGAAIYITATGTAAVSPVSASTGPDGSAVDIVTHVEQNGIAAATGPAPGLAGVFLTASAPDLSATPASTNYSGAAGTAVTISPLSKQVFLAGNGAGDGGATQRFITPADATRLYFGILDTGTWNNTGAYTVTVSNAMQWTNPAGGNWATTSNWSQPLTPTAADAVEFNLANTYAVNFTSPAIAYRAAITNGNVTYALAGQTLSVANGVIVGGTVTSPAKLSITGGNVAASTMTVANYGTLDLAAGSRLTATTSLTGGTITGNGGITGAVTNAGVISPGNGNAGVITITGTYAQSTGTLSMQLAGLSGSQIDKLIVSGTATLGGTFSVTKISGFEPHLGDSFDLIDAGSFIGSFSTVQLPTLVDPGDRWDISRLNTEGIITVVLVPEPAMGVMVLAPLILRRRRQRV